jgi:uncharacterized DUF497 family protein
MEIEWDGKKAISNLKKHGIDFADAVTVFQPHSRGCIYMA